MAMRPRAGVRITMTVSTCPISAGIKLQGPRPLALRSMNLRAEPGVYVVSSGDCISHVGSSGRLADRVRTLAHLGTHRGSARVLCAAHCTGEAPQEVQRLGVGPVDVVRNEQQTLPAAQPAKQLGRRALEQVAIACL